MLYVEHRTFDFLNLHISMDVLELQLEIEVVVRIFRYIDKVKDKMKERIKQTTPMFLYMAK